MSMFILTIVRMQDADNNKNAYPDIMSRLDDHEAAIDEATRLACRIFADSKSNSEHIRRRLEVINNSMRSERVTVTDTDITIHVSSSYYIRVRHMSDRMYEYAKDKIEV